jgi:ATP-binding cassette subfamily F protein 3
MIEEALNNYEGTVVVVSHDRHFISKIATRIVEINEGSMTLYPGNYEYYLEMKQKERERKEEERLEAERRAKAAEKRAKNIEKDKAKREKARAEKSSRDAED